MFQLEQLVRQFAKPEATEIDEAGFLLGFTADAL